MSNCSQDYRGKRRSKVMSAEVAPISARGLPVPATRKTAEADDEHEKDLRKPIDGEIRTEDHKGRELKSRRLFEVFSGKRSIVRGKANKRCSF
jgi:hypothetical protein